MDSGFFFPWKLFLFTFNDEIFFGVEKKVLVKKHPEKKKKNPLKDVGLDGGVLFV